MESLSWRRIAFAMALTTLAGFVDGVGYFASGSYFVSFMSGNTTRWGQSVSFGDGRAAAYAFGLIVAFVAGVVLGSLAAARAGARRKSVVLAMSAMALAIACGLSWFGQVGWAVAFMAAAMGIKNNVFMKNGEVSIGLTYMTGTLVRAGQKIGEALSGGAKWAWTRHLALWVGMAFGALLGTLGVSTLGLAGALGTATGLVGILAIAARAMPIEIPPGIHPIPE